MKRPRYGAFHTYPLTAERKEGERGVTSFQRNSEEGERRTGGDMSLETTKRDNCKRRDQEGGAQGERGLDWLQVNFGACH